MFCFGVVFICPVICSIHNGFENMETKVFIMDCCDFAGDSTMGQKR